MGTFQSLTLIMLLAVYQCEGDTNFNTYKTLHPHHVNVDWMKCIPDEKLLSSVSIPGTHQSITSSGLLWYRYQAWELQNQLYAGVRFFDIDVKKSWGTLYVKTGNIFHTETFDDVLKQMQVFLKDKKSETLLLRVTPDTDAASKTKQVLSHDTVIEVWRKRKIPKMGEVRGKIVLIQSSTFDMGLPVNAMVLDTSHKEEQMKENIRKASRHCGQEMLLTDSGAKGTFEYPETVARTLNKQIDDHLLSLFNTNSRPPCLGIIAMDFPGPKLIQLIIDFNCHLGGHSISEPDTGPDGVVALNETSTQTKPAPASITGTKPTPVPDQPAAISVPAPTTGTQTKSSTSDNRTTKTIKHKPKYVRKKKCRRVHKHRHSRFHVKHIHINMPYHTCSTFAI